MSILIYWIIFSILEPLRHLYYIKTRKKSPRKWLSLTIRVIVGLTMIVYEWKFNDYQPKYIIVPAYIFSGIFLHDTIMAVGTGIIFKDLRSPWYVNKHGVFDKPQNAYAPYIWFGKLFLGVGFPAVYYFTDFSMPYLNDYW